MFLENEIVFELKNKGADFVYFVDISELSSKQNRGYSKALLFGMKFSPHYIQDIINIPDYVQRRIETNLDFEDVEQSLKESKSDELADYMAKYLMAKGYRAYSQSDNNQMQTSDFDGQYGETLLPYNNCYTGWFRVNR